MISHSNRPRRVPASLARRTKQQTNQIQIFYVILISVDNWHYYQKRRVHLMIDQSFANRRINSIKIRLNYLPNSDELNHVNQSNQSVKMMTVTFQSSSSGRTFQLHICTFPMKLRRSPKDVKGLV